MWISRRICDHQAQGSGSFKETWVQMTTVQCRQGHRDLIILVLTWIRDLFFFPNAFLISVSFYILILLLPGDLFFTLPILVIVCTKDRVLGIYKLLGLWSYCLWSWDIVYFHAVSITAGKETHLKPIPCQNSRLTWILSKNERLKRQ